MISRIIAGVIDRMIPLQPAEPSTLDLWDSPRRWDGCMVLDCTAPVSDDTHGWRTCTIHAPATAATSACAGSAV